MVIIYKYDSNLSDSKLLDSNHVINYIKVTLYDNLVIYGLWISLIEV